MLDLETFERAERATGGFDTTVWHLERGGRQYALRVFRPDQMPTLQRELVALGAARGGGVPVPRVHAIGTFQERPALLMQWSNGRPLLDELRARPAQLLTLGVRFGRQHAAIHRIPAPASLRTNWIAWAGPLEPGFAAQLEQLTATSREAAPPGLSPAERAGPGRPCERGAGLDQCPRGRSARRFRPHGDDPAAEPAKRADLERSQRLLLELGWRYGYGAAHTREDMAPFYAWAGAAMQHDLAGRFSAAELAHVRRWTDSWRPTESTLTPDP